LPDLLQVPTPKIYPRHEKNQDYKRKNNQDFFGVMRACACYVKDQKEQRYKDEADRQQQNDGGVL